MQEKTKINLKKKVGIAALVVTVAGAGIFGVTKVNAATTDTTSPVSSLVQEIATKFGLNQADVQAVFDQNRTEKHAEREAKYEQQLTQYVTDGKITEQQKQLILAKHKEMEALHETDKQNIKTMKEEQRKAAMDKRRTELETWAKENNIDLQYVMPFGKGGHPGPRMKFGTPTDNATQSPTSSQTTMTQ